MAGTISRPPEAAPVARELPPLTRFDAVERAVHWLNATLFGVLLATAAALYVAPISAAVGEREVVKTIHVYAGLALPVPLLAGSAGRWGRGLRSDLRRLNRWIPDDRRWLAAKFRRGDFVRRARHEVRLGKFNPGQKLNAAFTGGAIVVMLATGSIMRWYKPWPLSLRTGATFVHDWVATLLAIAIAGHVYLALSDSDAFRAMIRGRISRAWARRHAPRWLEEFAPPDG